MTGPYGMVPGQNLTLGADLDPAIFFFSPSFCFFFFWSFAPDYGEIISECSLVPGGRVQLGVTGSFDFILLYSYSVFCTPS